MVRQFGVVEKSLPNQEVPGSIPSSGIELLFTGKSFHGMFGVDVSVFQSRYSSCFISEEGPCTLLTTSQGRPSN